MKAETAATLALLPTVETVCPPIQVGDTLVCTKRRLYRPTIYTADGAEIKPVIGVVVETLQNLIAIHWDGYANACDYTVKEIEASTAILARHSPGRVHVRRARPQNAIAKDAAGFVFTDKGEWITPEWIL